MHTLGFCVCASVLHQNTEHCAMLYRSYKGKKNVSDFQLIHCDSIETYLPVKDPDRRDC